MRNMPAQTWSRLRYAVSRIEEPAPDKRQWLLDMLPPHSVGAEIGVWRGDFAAQLLWHVRPRKLHLIDPWRFEPDLAEAWYGGSAATSQDDMDAIYKDVRGRFRRMPVVWHRQSSMQAAKAIDGPLDWAYIDGNHQYEFVSEDLRVFWGKIASGGILSGDDYHNHGWWGDGVIRAVDEFVASRRCELVERGRGGQYVIRKP